MVLLEIPSGRLLWMLMRVRDSNPRPSGYEPNELAAALTRPTILPNIRNSTKKNAPGAAFTPPGGHTLKCNQVSYLDNQV